MNLCKGRFRARVARTMGEVQAAQRLRSVAFHNRWDGLDVDAFDPLCVHVLVEDTGSGELVCCFRLLPLQSGLEIGGCYAAQYYELSALQGFDGPMVEMGRFCVHPDWKDPDILRVAWAAMTRYVDEAGIELMFGCASFRGTNAEAYQDAFAMLRDRHIAPKRWLPRVKAPKVFRFASRLRCKPDMKQAMLRMPPLLKTYLMMGGWVSDHAVVDTQMNTLHVFTGVEINAIPPARKRLLRAVAS